MLFLLRIDSGSFTGDIMGFAQGGNKSLASESRS